MEFVIPLSNKPVGSLIQAETGGLDPESWIEVSVNGESRGILAPASFSLSDPAVVIPTPNGHLQVAGWRSASVFIPARLWTSGENSVILTLHRAAGDAGAAVYLRRVRADLLFSSTWSHPGNAPEETPMPAPAAKSAPMNNTNSSALSTGSLYGNPSPSLFHASAPTPLPAGSLP